MHSKSDLSLKPEHAWLLHAWSCKFSTQRTSRYRQDIAQPDHIYSRYSTWRKLPCHSDCIYLFTAALFQLYYEWIRDTEHGVAMPIA